MQHIDELILGPTSQGYCSRCRAEACVPMFEDQHWTWCEQCRDTVKVTQCAAPNWAVVTTIGLAAFCPTILHLLNA